MWTNYKFQKMHFDGIGKGYVYIYGNKSIELRSIIKLSVKCGDNNKRIYCEALNVDDDYLRSRGVSFGNNEKVIFIDQWYRNKLCLYDLREEYSAQVIIANNIYKKIYFSVFSNMLHPQNVVRTSFWLALLSIIISLLSSYLILIVDCIAQLLTVSYHLLMSTYIYFANLNYDSLVSIVKEWQTIIGSMFGALTAGLIAIFISLKETRKQVLNAESSNALITLSIVQDMINEIISITISLDLLKTLVLKTKDNVEKGISEGLVNGGLFHIEIQEMLKHESLLLTSRLQSGYMINQISDTTRLANGISNEIRGMVKTFIERDKNICDKIFELSKQHQADYDLIKDGRIKSLLLDRLSNLNTYVKLISIHTSDNLPVYYKSLSKSFASLELYNNLGLRKWNKRYNVNYITRFIMNKRGVDINIQIYNKINKHIKEREGAVLNEIYSHIEEGRKSVYVSE